MRVPRQAAARYQCRLPLAALRLNVNRLAVSPDALSERRLVVEAVYDVVVPANFVIDEFLGFPTLHVKRRCVIAKHRVIGEQQVFVRAVVERLDWFPRNVGTLNAVGEVEFGWGIRDLLGGLAHRGGPGGLGGGYVIAIPKAEGLHRLRERACLEDEVIDAGPIGLDD